MDLWECGRRRWRESVLVGLVGCAVMMTAQPLAFADAVKLKLGRVTGPSFSRIKAAIQVVLRDYEEVLVVRKGHQVALSGEIKETTRGFTADLILESASGDERTRGIFRGADAKALAADVKERFWATMGRKIASMVDSPPPVVEQPATPAVPKEKPEVRTQKRAQKTTVVVAGDDALGSEVLRFSLGVGLFSRSFAFADARGDLAGYDLGTAPAFRLDVAWFPGAYFSDGFLQHIGLEVETELPFAVQSNRDGQDFPTAASAWRVGLLGRLPFSIFEGQFGLGFAERRFHIEVAEDGSVVPDLPEVRYQILSARLRVLARIHKNVDLSGHAGWGFMLDDGEIGRELWFPNSSSHTAQLGLAGIFRFSPRFGVFGRFDWQGAFFDFSPELDDNRIAGGASDNYFLGSLGLSYSTARL